MSDKNVDRARKDSLLRLVDTDGTGTIDAQEFAVLYDAIRKDLAEDAENNAALEKEASSATRRFKMLLLFVAVLVSFLAASVAANFAVLFTFVDSAITTATTASGLLEVKGSDTIVKTAIATQDVPLLVAPVLDLDTLSEVKSLKVVYSTLTQERIEAQLTVVGVRKHNSTFVEFVTSVPGETVQTLNGVAELVRYPSSANGLTSPMKHKICSANATCSAMRVNGIDVASAADQARAELHQAGFEAAARRLAPSLNPADCVAGSWYFAACSIFGGLPCPVVGLADALVYYYSGYLPSATRHVVFILHGWGGNAGYMWGIYCNMGWFSCPALEVDAFKHLAFVFPSSAVMGYYDGDWAMAWNPNLESTPTLEVGAAMLSTLMCGSPLSWAMSYCFGYGFLGLFGVGGDSEVMIFGYSNGGALAEFSSWAYGTMVTKAVSIDYLSQVPEDAYWVPTYFGLSGAAGFNLKVYFNCDSWLFTDMNVPAMRNLGGMGSYTKSWTVGGGFGRGYKSYTTYTFSGSGKQLIYAVHGWNTNDVCVPGYQTMCPGCDGTEAHGTVPYFADLVGDVTDWVGSTSAPTTSSAPSPAPPPFPPLTRWIGLPAKVDDLPPPLFQMPFEALPSITTKQICKAPSLEDFMVKKDEASKFEIKRKLLSKYGSGEGSGFGSGLKIHSEKVYATAMDLNEKNYVDISPYALLEKKYEQEAIAKGLVYEVDGETVYRNYMTKEQALAEPAIPTGAAAAPKPVLSAEQLAKQCETEVVTINAPKVSMKYDPARDKALRIRLDSIYGSM